MSRPAIRSACYHLLAMQRVALCPCCCGAWPVPSPGFCVDWIRRRETLPAVWGLSPLNQKPDTPPSPGQPPRRRKQGKKSSPPKILGRGKWKNLFISNTPVTRNRDRQSWSRKSGGADSWDRRPVKTSSQNNKVAESALQDRRLNTTGLGSQGSE